VQAVAAQSVHKVASRIVLGGNETCVALNIPTDVPRARHRKYGTLVEQGRTCRTLMSGALACDTVSPAEPNGPQTQALNELRPTQPLNGSA
jgi:hypothetical protein